MTASTTAASAAFSNTTVAPDTVSRLVSVFPDASFETMEGSRWGVLLRPPTFHAAAKGARPLRIAMFSSFWLGHAAIQATTAFCRRYPEAIQLVGLATDDPISPHARIALRKRAWALMNEEERWDLKLKVVEAGLRLGAPVFTGEIKTPGFRRELAAWRPDVILCTGFGQIFDQGLIETPPMGSYNCHPTDLGSGHGAGPAPWTDMWERRVSRTVWTLHSMTTEVDGGPVVATTPPINVSDERGIVFSDPRAFAFKVMDPVGWMVIRALQTFSNRFHRGELRPVDRIDVEETCPPWLREKLNAPIAADWEARGVPAHGPLELDWLEKIPAP